MPTLNKFVMSYVLRKFKNARSSSNNRWFAYVNKTGNITTRGLAEFLIQLGVMLDRSDLEKIIIKLTQAIPAIVAQGYGVKLQGLGTFYPTLEAKGAETPVGYNIEEYLKGVHVRFTPEGCEDDNITSREMKNRVSLKQNMIFDLNGVPKKVKDGQLVDYGVDDEDDEDEGNEG